MTREELEEAIEAYIDTKYLGGYEHSGCYQEPGSSEILDIIEKAGGKILMPVQEGQSVAQVIALTEPHVLKTTQSQRDAGLWVNILEES